MDTDYCLFRNAHFWSRYGGSDLQPGDILEYFEELEIGSNAEIGQKNRFWMSNDYQTRALDSVKQA